MEIRRKVKNVVYKYSESERLVREATSNDPWGPTSTVMSEIADITYETESFDEVMQIIWKRLNDKGKNWRHVYKCLVLLDYLIKCGDERVSILCSSNIHAIETLKDFQYFEEHKDLGLVVREKSKSLVIMLRNDDVLNLERQKGQVVREKFQGPKNAQGSNKSRRPGDLGKEIRKQHIDKESRFPKSVIQLNFDQNENNDDENYQKAIALSKMEHDESLKKKLDEEKLEDMKIKLALEQSKKEDEALSILRLPPKNNDAVISIDLLSLSNDADPEINTLSNVNMAPHWDLIDKCDPWGESRSNNATLNTSLDFDPWATETNFALSQISKNHIVHDVWPSNTNIQKQDLLDDIFDENKPSVPSDPVWNVNDRNTSFPTKAVYESGLFPSDMNTFHLSNNGTGSLASLTDIGMRNQEDSMHHSRSVANLSANKTKKTAHEFLGINADLINFDNLLPKPKEAPKNPFGVNSNPFNNLTVQNKTPMNQMATGTSQNYMFSSVGMTNMNTMNTQSPPQLSLAYSQSQNLGQTVNSCSQGGVVWAQQPPTGPSTMWLTHANTATSNPFFN